MIQRKRCVSYVKWFEGVWSVKTVEGRNRRLDCPESLGDDISSKMLAFAFGLSAEIERKMISQRVREALANVKASGKVLGRPLGRRNTKSKLASRASEVQHLLSCGYSRTAVARKLNVHRDTLAAFLNSQAK